MIDLKILEELEEERKYNFFQKMIDEKKMKIYNDYIFCVHMSCRECVLISSTCSKYKTIFTTRYPELTL